MALDHGMIDPFAEGEKRPGVISYGLSSYGYDFRVAGEFRLYNASPGAVLDPKDASRAPFQEIRTETFVEIPPHGIAVARSVERFRIPRSVVTVTFGKSTYARMGLVVNITPFEPEWEGHVTLEISNTAPLPARVYANEGIAQVLFLESDEVCATSYADRQGKYQGQKTITAPKVV
jgi:dCTP deaminase